MLNSMIASWILNVIDLKLQTSVAYANMAKTMWETLKKRYAITSAPNIHQLKANIANCMQGGLSIVEFYSKIRDLWIELGNYVKVPHCKCSGCKCGAANEIMQMYEEEKAHQFFMGLNDDTYS